MTIIHPGDPWPDGWDMWWCVCSHDDTRAVLYGPFHTLKAAQHEASINPDTGERIGTSSCKWAHFAVTGRPNPADDLKRLPCVNHGSGHETIDDERVGIAWVRWFYAEVKHHHGYEAYEDWRNGLDKHEHILNEEEAIHVFSNVNPAGGGRFA